MARKPATKKQVRKLVTVFLSEDEADGIISERRSAQEGEGLTFDEILEKRGLSRLDRKANDKRRK